jgi:hypothetical protein
MVALRWSSWVRRADIVVVVVVVGLGFEL